MFLDLSFSCYGFITAWTLKTHAAGKVYIDVYRRYSGGIFKLIAKTEVTVNNAGVHTIPLLLADVIAVEPGDVIGYHYDSDSSNGIIALASNEYSMASVTYASSDLSRVYHGEHFDNKFSVGSLFGPFGIDAERSIPTIKPIFSKILC